jgi:hypothetical protein
MPPQKRKVGSILQINLGNSQHSYAQLITEGAIAVFMIMTGKDLDVETIVRLPVLFTVLVHKDAITKGIWKVIGKEKVRADMKEIPPMFIQEIINKDKFKICQNGKIREASREECEGLEACAVWESNHVEDRIRDHFAGRKNVWVEQLRINRIE